MRSTTKKSTDLAHKGTLLHHLASFEDVEEVYRLLDREIAGAIHLRNKVQKKGIGKKRMGFFIYIK